MPPKAPPKAAAQGEAPGDQGKVTKQHVQACDVAVRHVKNGNLSKALEKLREAKPPRTLLARATACCYLVHSDEQVLLDGDQQRKLGALKEAAAAVEAVSSQSLLASYLACVAQMHLAKATEPDGMHEAMRVFLEGCNKPPGLRVEAVPDGLLLKQERDLLHLLTTKDDPLDDPPVMVWHLSTAIEACVRVGGSVGCAQC